MSFKHTIYTALRALRAQKTRSALTILGIVIGVAAIIIVMSIGSGAQALILNQISGLGAETVILRPGSGFLDVESVLFAESLKEDDIDELQSSGRVPNLVELYPFVIVASNVQYQGERYSPSVYGGSVEFFINVMDIPLLEGQIYGEDETEGASRVAVIGYELKQEIFGDSNAIGEDLEISDTKFKIIGVLARKGSVGRFDFNNTVMVPETSALAVTGRDFYNEVIMTVDSIDNLEKAVFDIESAMREIHEIEPGEDDDFNVTTQEEAIEQIQSIIAILTAFLSLVVAVSLVVGGIGIMNIMLVSVTERTKEIGLRKALGARRTDILRQFLYEAVILTSIGGLVGILFGAAFSFAAALVLSRTVDESWAFVFPISAAILGVGVSAGVGLIFGIYPASQASKKSPIEALRYE